MTEVAPYERPRRTSLGASLLRGLCISLLGWMAVTASAAQEADSVRAALDADSLRADQADSLRAVAPSVQDSAAVGERSAGSPAAPVGARLESESERFGAAVADTLPARLAALDMAELLGRLPGSFVYRFAVPGWPDGWSPAGLPPHRSLLLLDERPFNHLFTGRPAFDVAPLALIDPPRLAPNRFGRPFAVSMRTRSFDAARPLTELKYWKGGDGLESIDAVHAQNRRVRLFGAPVGMNVTGSYSGRGSDGEYPGTDLHRGRQVQLRLRFERPGWSAELHDVHTRRSVGAHGGVVPDGTAFESVYRRLGAVVERPEARRRLVRNDLSATFRMSLFGDVTTLGAFWTAETFRYRDAVDTVGTGSDRFGVRLRRPLPGGFDLDVQGWTDRISPRYRYGALPLRRWELHASVQDSVELLGWTAAAEGGVHVYDGGTLPGGFVEIGRSAGSLRLSAGVALSGEPTSAVERMGFPAVGAARNHQPGRLIEAHTTLAWRGETFDVSLRAFGSRTAGARDLFMMTDYQATPDSAAFLATPSAVMRVGATLDLGWRREAERGFYALVQPSVVRVVDEVVSDLHLRLSRSLPSLFGRARLGARYALFLGDLDFDAFAETHAWSGTVGRALHPESGLLAVPLLGAMAFGPTSMINLGIEADVRDATLFAIYENALSGTTIMIGNLIVPIYPLPARRFRFGVFWPIFD